MKHIDVNEALDLMTPGSVWKRPDGRESIVLMVTNTSLPEHIQAKNPMQVVYWDSEHNLLSTTVSAFISKRNFYSVVPNVERLVNNLLASDVSSDDEVDELLTVDAGSSDDDEDDEGGDQMLSLSDDEDSDEDFMQPVATKKQSVEALLEPKGTVFDQLMAQDADDQALEAEVDDTLDWASVHALNFVAADPELKVAVDLNVLSGLVYSYEQTPMVTDSPLLHKITFLNAPELDAITLARCFNGDESTDEFSPLLFNLPGHSVVDWDNIVGIYPGLTNGISVNTVVLIEHNYPSENTDADLDDDEPVIAVETGAPIEGMVVVATGVATGGAGIIEPVGKTQAFENVVSDLEPVAQPAVATTPINVIAGSTVAVSATDVHLVQGNVAQVTNIITDSINPIAYDTLVSVAAPAPAPVVVQ